MLSADDHFYWELEKNNFESQRINLRFSNLNLREDKRKEKKEGKVESIFRK